MKKYSYIGIAFVVLIFGIWVVPKVIDKFKGGEELVTMGKVPDFEFMDQHGKMISNKDYEGKVYVVEFFFTTCPTICPMMNRNMVKLQNKFFGNPNFGVASFSINPENDTPEVLQEYAKKYEISNPHWHLLTGERDKIFTLANKGFNLYAGIGAEQDGGFEHSGMFALIDKNGNIRCRKDEFGNPIVYYNGIEDEGVQMIEKDIATLLSE